ncbi:hypothetical protein CBS101457_006492 [Exobasidium rhododendri]|nr:hypothetical protein CBS101457_006492 [Exobasidium rhododendri]
MAGTGRNSAVSANVGHLSRSKLYQKKGLHKTKGARKAAPAAKLEDVPASKSVDIKGGKRNKPTVKAFRFYPAEDIAVPRRTRKSPSQAKLRSNITPGTVLILLAGRFRGKRVVFLKQLESGLLLVTGPFKVNGVPIRRVNQAYVIATSTKLDIGSVKVDEKLNDAYFNKEKLSGAKPEASFFADPKNKAAHPEAKVADQKSLDKSVIEAVKKAGPAMAKYLAASFSLSSGDRPHAMRF